jgi:hypothetical protein
MLYIVANGKAAHTMTYTAGVGNGGGTMDVGTFNATEATGCVLMAVNGFWVLMGERHRQLGHAGRGRGLGVVGLTGRAVCARLVPFRSRA